LESTIPVTRRVKAIFIFIPITRQVKGDYTRFVGRYVITRFDGKYVTPRFVGKYVTNKWYTRFVEMCVTGKFRSEVCNAVEEAFPTP